jgi:hypothetical protein
VTLERVTRGVRPTAAGERPRLMTERGLFSGAFWARLMTERGLWSGAFCHSSKDARSISAEPGACAVPKGSSGGWTTSVGESEAFLGLLGPFLRGLAGFLLETALLRGLGGSRFLLTRRTRRGLIGDERLPLRSGLSLRSGLGGREEKRTLPPGDERV